MVQTLQESGLVKTRMISCEGKNTCTGSTIKHHLSALPKELFYKHRQERYDTVKFISVQVEGKLTGILICGFFLPREVWEALFSPCNTLHRCFSWGLGRKTKVTQVFYLGSVSVQVIGNITHH